MEGILGKAHKYMLMETDISTKNFQGYSKVLALEFFADFFLMVIMIYPGIVSALSLIKNPHYSN